MLVCAQTSLGGRTEHGHLFAVTFLNRRRFAGRVYMHALSCMTFCYPQWLENSLQFVLNNEHLQFVIEFLEILRLPCKDCLIVIEMQLHLEILAFHKLCS